MEFDPVSYLAGKGVRGRAASGGREMVYPCFFDCGEAPDSKKKKLYLNTVDGFYHCKVCDTSGGSYTLQQHFGDAPHTASSDDAFQRRRILDAAAATGVEMLNNNDTVLLYLLNERGLSEDTIIRRQIGFVSGGWSLVGNLPEGFTREQIRSTGLVYRDGPRQDRDFFYRHILIPYPSHNHVLQLRGRMWGEASGGKYMTGPGEPTRVYNSDALEGAEEVIITEGEFDAMILQQTLERSPEPRAKKIAVIAVPGTSAIPEEIDQLLSDIKRIYIGFDSDAPGKKGADTLKERLGPRARLLELPCEDGRKCDWTEYLLPSESPSGQASQWRTQHPYAGHTWRDVFRLMSSAAGKRIFSMAEAGEAYRSYRTQNKGMSTGFMNLDGTIYPGLLPGQVVIVLAKTGTGKTIFLCNVAYNMRASKVLFVSLEMTREEVYERLQRIYLHHHPKATVADVDEGLANIFVCDENRLGARDLNALASEYAIEAGERPEVVLVDYLGYYARGFPGHSPYEKVGNAVMELKAEAKTGRFVIISPSQVNRGAKEGQAIDLDDARDAGQVEETADFLLSLYRPGDALQSDGSMASQGQSGKLKMDLLKSRHGGKGKQFGLVMDLLTLRVVDDPSVAAKDVYVHNQMHNAGQTWDYLRTSQTAPEQMQIHDRAAQLRGRE